ncbi:hypothetical protein SNEBB_003104 [Seison nebaliae]|nr:hypothetical protein SNEBB_003104 [Seison nebaliae]
MNAENHLISKAIESDERGDFDEALACYKSGVEILLKERLPKCNETEREILKSKISEYLSRAEHLKKITTLRRCRKTFNIEHDEVGKGYRTVFSSIFATTFSKMKILDPYIIHPHQFDNLMSH